MYAILHGLWVLMVNLCKSRRRLEAENLLLRHQLSVALRKSQARLRLRGSDRALMVWLTCPFRKLHPGEIRRGDRIGS
jgi:hypothetical protein